MQLKIALAQAIREEEDSHRAVGPIGLAYLSAAVKQVYPQSEIRYFTNPEDLIAFSPHLVGMTSVTENIPRARKMAGEIKNKLNVPIVLGGPHLSNLPKSLPPEFDAGVMGEGEATFTELVTNFWEKGNFTAGLEQIPGLVFRGEKDFVITPRRALIEPLEQLPFPDRGLYGWNKFMYLMTSRGCLYHCVYCAPRVIWRRYRAFPARYVVDEILNIMQKSRRNYIHWFDDLCVADLERLREIARLIKEHKINEKISFGGHLRADLLTPEVVELLKEINFVSGAFGMESASPRILEFLKCGSSNVEENQKALDLCHQNGMTVNASFIIGVPGETPLDLSMTFNFIKKNRKKIGTMELFILTPFPGTRIWYWALKKGLVSLDMNWERFSTKPFFSDMQIRDDFIYMNQDMIPKKQFLERVKAFQELDEEINRPNKDLYKNLAFEDPFAVE